MIMEHNLSVDAYKRNNKVLLFSQLEISICLKSIHFCTKCIKVTENRSILYLSLYISLPKVFNQYSVKDYIYDSHSGAHKE
jgi:hypothetical protein